MAIRGRIAEGYHIGDHRDIPSSDHEAVLIVLQGDQPSSAPAKQAPAWGPRPLRFPPVPEDQVQSILQPHGDIHRGLQEAAMAVTTTRTSARYRESVDLKKLRRQAQVTPPGTERRSAWKAVLRKRKEEHKAWMRQLVKQAGERSWASYRELKTQRRPHKSWEAKITDDPDWKESLLIHFKGIFAKEDPSAVRRTAKALHDQLTKQCKVVAWNPFREDELRPIMAKWKNNKSTGTDRISLEAVRYISLTRGGLGRLLWLLNDILYVSKLPPGLDDGLAILLPKVPAPQDFTDTRPITLSNILLKTLAQLLLRRGLPLLRPIGTLQFCKTGSQSVELIMALRRLAQQAHEWREKFWIIKLDVRKAFDSISQQYLSTLVKEKIGDTLPWEARAWLQVIGARGFRVAFGEETLPVDQTNGVRQGSPDSPSLYPRLPPAPFGIGAFMDDTYVWGANKACSTRSSSGSRSGAFEINPKKTMVICSTADGGSFTIGGQTVSSLGPEAIMPVLGSPVTFINAPGALVGEMQHRARKSFHANKQLLCCAEAKLDDRLRSSITLLRSAALWACETWPISDYLLRAANSLQYHYVREIIGRKRKPQEEWTSWNQRSLSEARLVVHRNKACGGRWSTFILRVRWQLLGHVARHPNGGERSSSSRTECGLSTHTSTTRSSTTSVKWPKWQGTGGSRSPSTGRDGPP